MTIYSEALRNDPDFQQWEKDKILIGTGRPLTYPVIVRNMVAKDKFLEALRNKGLALKYEYVGYDCIVDIVPIEQE